jgi:hypothetical protein
MVESSHTIRSTERDPQRLRDESQTILFEISESLLYSVESLDQSVWLKSVPSHRGLYQLPSFVLRGRCSLNEVHLQLVYLPIIS